MALTVLLAGVQVAARLHRSSVSTAVVTDAAHRVAQASGPAEAERARASAAADIRRVLGPSARIRWGSSATVVSVEVEVDSPRVPGLPAVIRRGASARREAPG